MTIKELVEILHDPEGHTYTYDSFTFETILRELCEKYPAIEEPEWRDILADSLAKTGHCDLYIKRDVRELARTIQNRASSHNS
jgi:hypothetical protein